MKENEKFDAIQNSNPDDFSLDRNERSILDSPNANSASSASGKKAKKEDKRTKFTKMFLREALLHLMEKKPVSEITATELCRTADINRNTFYSHYSAVQDVLKALEDDIERQLLTNLSFDAPPKDMIRQIITNIYSNYKIFSVLLSPNGDFGFAKRLFKKIENSSIEDLKKHHINLTNTEMHYLFSFLFVGSSAVIQSWLSDGAKESPEDISNLIFNLIENGISYYMNN